MNAQFFLVVRFWVTPQAEAEVLRWLDGGHAAQVLRQPGFLWCRRLRLGERDGWRAHSMIYGIESRAAFEAYNTDTALHQRFAEERKPFEQNLRIERFFGDVALALDKPV